MKTYISQHTPKDIGRMMAMPGYLHEGYSWELYTLGPIAFNYDDVATTNGVILNTQNVSTVQEPFYQEVGTSDWEVLQKNGGVADMAFAWDEPDRSTWFSEKIRPTRMKITNTTSSSSSRLTVQTNSDLSFNLTGKEVAGMCLIMRNVHFAGNYSAQMHLGLGNWKQSSDGSGAPSIRGGSWNCFFGGSGNKGAVAYNASNAVTNVYKNWSVSNPDWAVNKKSGDDFGVFVRKTPANVPQNGGPFWKWEAGTIWNGTIDVYSENSTPGKAVDINSICGMSNATNWGAYFTVRGQNPNMNVSFAAMELWVAKN